MHTYPRPSETHLHVDRVPLAGNCPECGADDLAGYPVLSEGGWWKVVKCQACLASASRTPAADFALHTFSPLGSR